MFERILIAVDGSTDGQAAVDYGAYLAVESGARIDLLHIIDWRLLVGHFITHFDDVFRAERHGSFSERVKEYYRRYGDRIIGQARERCSAFGVNTLSWSIETGNVARHLIERAAAADLLVIGQHGEAPESEAGFVGSVTERVVHHVNTPALVVQAPLRGFRRALLAYDGSASAHRAMESLAGLADALKLEVDVVHLIEERKDTTSLKQAEEYLSRHPISYVVHYLEGDSHTAILEHAKQSGCDLLVMGAFADREVEVLALGTTTEALLGQSRIPVLVHR